MKRRFLLFLIILSSNLSIAQIKISKSEVESVLEETLTKSRTNVPYAKNSWRYDNTNEDYLKKDTITLFTANPYKVDYCKEIRWSFYEKEKFVLENTPECTEPPTMLKPRKEDYIDLVILEKNQKLHLMLKNENQILDEFIVLDLKKNEPILEEEYAYDYTLTLERINDNK